MTIYPAHSKAAARTIILPKKLEGRRFNLDQNINKIPIKLMTVAIASVTVIFSFRKILAIRSDITG